MFTVQSTSAATAHPGADLTDVLVARQPIFDRDRKVQAYELLYRSEATGPANVSDGDKATACVVTASFLDIGLERMSEGRRAFINLTQDLLVSRAALALPPEKVVLEILEDVVVDDALVGAVEEFVANGYRVALDDFVYDDSWRPLLALAHIVKLDVMALSMDQVREHLELLAPYELELLAEKVETEEQYCALREMGFSYFQGFFFAKPNVLIGSRLPGNRTTVMKLLAQLQDPEADMDEVGNLVAQDPSLSYRLLRFINSAAVGLPTRITSIHRAVLYIGIAAVKRWVSLMVLASVDDKPTELTRMTLVRARMTEKLCALAANCDRDVGFTVGLFSTLDAFMDRPLPELLDELPLSTEVFTALLEGAGGEGEALQCVLAYEKGSWDRAEFHSMGVPLGSLAEIYDEAVEWAAAAAAAAL
jgi:EAL and modified HD-GYP domain-containing signal transduction protein